MKEQGQGCQDPERARTEAVGGGQATPWSCDLLQWSTASQGDVGGTNPETPSSPSRLSKTLPWWHPTRNPEDKELADAAQRGRPSGRTTRRAPKEDQHTGCHAGRWTSVANLAVFQRNLEIWTLTRHLCICKCWQLIENIFQAWCGPRYTCL